MCTYRYVYVRMYMYVFVCARFLCICPASYDNLLFILPKMPFENTENVFEFYLPVCIALHTLCFHLWLVIVSHMTTSRDALADIIIHITNTLFINWSFIYFSSCTKSINIVVKNSRMSAMFIPFKTSLTCFYIYINMFGLCWYNNKMFYLIIKGNILKMFWLQ